MRVPLVHEPIAPPSAPNARRGVHDAIMTMVDESYGSGASAARRFGRRFGLRILGYLKDGASPDKVSLAVALGITCGLFPIYGASTAVSALAGVIFRANPVIVQIFNYMTYPIYFPIAFAFILAGAWLFEGSLDAYTAGGVRVIVEAGVVAVLRQLGRALAHAAIVWLVIAPFAVILLKAALTPAIRRWQRVGHDKSERVAKPP